MKRMVYIWIGLIVALFIIGIFYPDYSLQHNIWSVNALILLMLMLSLELGLVWWRRRMRDMSDLLQRSRQNLRSKEHERHEG